MTYATLEEMVLAAAEAVRPPERITVSQAAERYHIVKNPGQHEGPFSLDKTPYLREPMDILTSLDYTGMIFAGPARTGKALDITTPIATPTGWTTMGALCPGDRVFDENGEPCRVLAATETMVDHDCYRVEFDDGTHIIADAGHRWKVDDRDLGDKIYTTEEMRNCLTTKRSGSVLRRFRIPITKALNLPDMKLPLDPYFLGLWLGDGFKERAMLCVHVDEGAHLMDMLAARRFVVASKDVSGAKAVRLTVSVEGETVASRLRKLGLLHPVGHKHIPEIYLRASEQQRRDLLKGLMDSDGAISTGSRHAVFTSVYPELSKQVHELALSLGYKAKLNTFNNASSRSGTMCRVTFTVYYGCEIFTLPNKIAHVSSVRRRERTLQTSHRAIKAIVPVSSVPVRCIQVDSPSHLFLAGHQMVPTHNSAMFINWLAHTAITDPADMMLIHMAQHTARDWSLADLSKALRNSPEMRKRLIPGKTNDNVYDKRFLSGMRLSVTWPTISNLSGKTIPRLWIMDLDRIKPQIIDKEGHVFDLAKKRAGTFKRYGMIGAEASPGFPVNDPKWLPDLAKPHQAPPCEGILSLYNRGDRRRWYWQCVWCGDHFEPRFNLIRWPNSTDVMESAEQAFMACPHCYERNQNPLTFAMQPELNHKGRWLIEGQHLNGDGSVYGTARRSDIASFWMFGPAAGFADWKTLVTNYLNALEDYDKTGDEGSLMTTVTVDQGEAYVSKLLESARLPETLKARAEDWGGHDETGRPYVPPALNEGGFLMAAIDVQAGARPSFVVHVFAISSGFDIWHLDMFKIVKSERRDEATGERQGLDPAAFPEDWDLLIDQVMNRTYPLPDGSGRHMAIKMSVCDSGGKDGVTRNAYEFYRKLRETNDHGRFHLVKGSPSRTESATIRLTMPDSQQKDRFAIARGDVPVWLVNSNIVKDMAANMLARDVRGGMVHFATWSENWLYSQLTTEFRMPDGSWKNPLQKRNEAWDLLVYCIAACDHPDIRIRFLDWDAPPSWAAPWDDNDFVIASGEVPFAPEVVVEGLSLAEIAAKFA